MPEGPELRRSRDQLQKYVGQTIVTAQVMGGRYESATDLVGFTELSGSTEWDGKSNCRKLDIVIKAIEVKGKFMWWELPDDWFLWCTYGMSGQWSREVTKHSAFRCQVKTSSGQNSWLAFNDIRHFGTLKFIKGRQQLDKKLSTLGFDFLSKEQSVTALWRFLKDCKKNLQDKDIGLVLMDQSVFAGVGNYLRAEILYQSKISPFRKLKDVSYEDLQKISDAAREIMVNSYNSNGATIATYRDAEGKTGSYSSKFAVYGRKTDPFGNEVIRQETADKRTIHWVPNIQK